MSKEIRHLLKVLIKLDNVAEREKPYDLLVLNHRQAAEFVLDH